MMKLLVGWLSIFFFIKEFVPLDATAPIRLGRDTFLPSDSPFMGVGGIIQVYHSGQWGTVCNGWFDMKDAKVACRQLGFKKTVGYWHCAQEKGKVWLYDMQCNGFETSLEKCTHNGWGNVHTDCPTHQYDVGVVCSGFSGSSSSTIRFEPGTEVRNAYAGLVEVYHQNQWGTVCDGAWGLDDAKVACRQLGFIKTVGPSHHGQGKGKVWLYNMECSGSENSLVNCPHNGWGSVNSYCNAHKYDAGVVCSGYQGKGFLTQIRITGSEGRIEIKYAYDGNSWGTICDNGFGLNKANVVCRMSE